MSGGTLPKLLPKTAAECEDLKQYRELVLGLSQREIARQAGTTQARVSQIEAGHLARRRYWPALMCAYRLVGPGAEELWYRLVLAPVRAAALKQPVGELFATATGSGGTVETLAPQASAAGREVRVG